MLTTILVIWAILAEKNEDKVYVNQEESLTDLQTLITEIFISFQFSSWIFNEFDGLLYRIGKVEESSLIWFLNLLHLDLYFS